MANKNAQEDLLYILTAIIIIMILSIIMYYVINIPRYRTAGQDWPGNLSEREFIDQMTEQNMILRQDVSTLQGQLADKNIIIGRLKEMLNMSAGIEPSQFSKISPEDIQVYDDRIVIYVKKAFPVSFTDSHSMYPFINKNVYALEVRPDEPEDLKKGDIIGFESKVFNTTIIHRIINISSDGEGWYAVTKGDSNPSPDPEKIRFESIKGVLVGLIY